MTSSRKVLVILSQHYLQSTMHMFEFDLATTMMYDHELEEIIVVHIDNGLPKNKIPKHLVHTMKRNKVVEWTENPDAQEHFTNTINDMLNTIAVAAEKDTE